MFDAGSIVGRLVLDTSGFQTSAVSASRRIEQLGQNIITTTRQLTRAASNMTFLGAAITAPIIAAFKSAEKYSNPVRTELEKMNNAFIGLRVSVAESLLPVMHQFGNVIADLVNRWNTLSPTLRENILRTALMTGVFLTLGGTISMIALKIIMLIGSVVKLTGVFLAFAAVNPALALIYVAIAGIVFAMLKWKAVGDIVMNTISILCDVAWAGLNSVLFVTDSIAAATLAIIPGCKKLSEQYAQLANDSLRRVGDAGKNVWDTLVTGQSNASRGLDDMKTQMQSWGDLFKNLGSQEVGVKNWQEAPKTFVQGWNDAWAKTTADLQNWGAMAENIVQQVASGMQSSISGFLMNVRDYFNGSRDFFVEFGNFILKILADVIAQIITAKIIAGIGTVFNFGAASVGSSNIAGSSFNTAGLSLGSYAEGTDAIQYTGNYRLHEGEKVTPKYDANKSGTIEVAIANHITPEAIATAMSGQEGKGVIVNTIDINALRNGSSRRTIRRK